MSDQFYEPAPGDLVACDDGLHFILLDEANAHCNWVMRRHPDGGLVSVRKATEHELAHAKARQHLRAGIAQIKGGERGMSLTMKDVMAANCRVAHAETLTSNHCAALARELNKLLADALAAQREEGLAREELMRLGYEQCKQRLADAEKHLSLMVEESDALRGEVNDAWAYAGSTGAGTQASSEWAAAKAFLASTGCADGEQPS